MGFFVIKNLGEIKRYISLKLTLGVWFALIYQNGPNKFYSYDHGISISPREDAAG